MTIEVTNILIEHGDINLNILYNELHDKPNITAFTIDGRQYGTEENELYRLMTYWNKIMR